VDHFYFPLDRRDPYDLMMRFVERQYGVPADIRTSSYLTGRELHFVPVYFFYVHGVAEAERDDGRRVLVEEVDFIGFPAVELPIAKMLWEYPFPIRGRRFFEERIMKMGRYYEPVIAKDRAERMALEYLRILIDEEARRSVEPLGRIIERRMEVRFRGLVHYPVWELHYHYKGKEYKGYVDGATGMVIEVEYPIALRARAVQMALAGLFILLGVLIPTTIIAITRCSPLALAAGTVTGIVAAMAPFTRTIKRVLKASQVSKFLTRRRHRRRGAHERFLRLLGTIRIKW